MLRAGIERERFRKCVLSASSIQRAVRLWRGRLLQKKFALLRKGAARRLQQAWRRRRAQRELEQRRAEAAVHLQRALRSHAARLVVRDARLAAAATPLQRRVRGMLVRGGLERDGVLLASTRRELQNGGGGATTVWNCLAYRSMQRSVSKPCVLKAGDWLLVVASESKGRRPGHQTLLELPAGRALARVLGSAAVRDDIPDQAGLPGRPRTIARLLLDELQ
eukprot:CAMPEP_0183482390 /NCGR_PEP_ID=MMETSP0370-20130417/176564_1 /TAXON_ID=268820 /ORGANISM="Peridinium aciculiferum, Strain PAER-2" /LENGTH=220 /DNA_ID=CAMNT_0025675569 /DNA_START=38 /DNA_END=697 /DNA_ORIENTATION=-